MFDDFVKAVLSKLPRFWGVTITVIILSASVGPSLMALWDKWRDRRSGRKDLERETQRLEVMKLRYEIEVLKQKLGGAGLASDEHAAPGAHPVASKETVPAAQTPKATHSAHPWGWIARLNARHPTASNLLLTVPLAFGWAAVVLSFYMVFFSIVFIISPDKDYSRSDAWSSLLAFAIIGALAVFAVQRLRTVRLALATARAGLPAAAGTP